MASRKPHERPEPRLGQCIPRVPADLLLDGLAVRFTDGYTAAMPILTGAVAAFDRRDLSPEELRWLWLAHITAGNLWNEHTLDTVHHVDIARGSGALATLPLALATRIGAHVLMGDLSAADVLLDAMKAVTEVTGIPSAPYGALLLAAWKGREPEALALIQATANRGAPSRRRVWAHHHRLHRGDALQQPRPVRRRCQSGRGGARLPSRNGRRALGCAPFELIEGATRSGQSVLANAAFQDSAATTQAAASDWALGIEARSRALLSDGADAEAAYKHAIDRLDGTKIRGELARAHLLYGEWLRRERRRAEARRGDFTPLTTCSPTWGWTPLRRVLVAAAIHGGDGPQAQRRDPWRADRAGGPGRQAGA